MKVFLDSCYIIYLKYAEDDEIFEFCIDLLKKLEEHDVFVNVAVLNEVVWILKKKYGVDLNEIFDFLDRFTNFVNIIPLDSEDYENMKEFMLRYNLKPSDALHVSSMKKGGIKTVVSEDPDFDKVEWIRRIWIGRERL